MNPDTYCCSWYGDKWDIKSCSNSNSVKFSLWKLAFQGKNQTPKGTQEFLFVCFCLFPVNLNEFYVFLLLLLTRVL